MAVIHGTDNDFKEIINNKIVIVDFFATWCGPCKMLSPVIEQLSEKFKDVKFVKIDVDECPNVSKSYGIMSVPTLLKFKNGILIDTKIGYINIEEFSKWISE